MIMPIGYFWKVLCNQSKLSYDNINYTIQADEGYSITTTKTALAHVYNNKNSTCTCSLECTLILSTIVKMTLTVL